MLKNEANTQRINLILPISAKKLLDEKAARSSISTQDVIRTYIQQGLALDTLVENGGEIICRMSDGRQALIGNSTGVFVQKSY